MTGEGSGFAAEKNWRIGEVSEMFGLPAHVLRFWETEFPQIRPSRTDKGQRVYNEETLKTIRQIQKLLHEDGLTIGGAKRVLAGVPREGIESDEGEDASAFLKMIETELEDLTKLLEQKRQ